MQHRMEWLERQHAVEKERTRIAKDIHDDLGSRLTRMMLLGQRTQEDIANPEKLATYAEKIIESAVKTMQTMDEIVWAVDPKKDTLDGLIGYINQYAREFLEETQIKCRLEMPTKVSSLVIPAEVRHELFLVLKEALNNAVKHARTSEVHLSLIEVSGVITIIVEDNGCGFDCTKTSGGENRNGLDNMRNRIEKLGGDFSLSTAPGQGTKLKFTVTVDSTGSSAAA
jgi:signal transduction histidine kinase